VFIVKLVVEILSVLRFDGLEVLERVLLTDLAI